MLLESDYNNDDKIRRKAYPVDNPVQNTLPGTGYKSVKVELFINL